VKANNEYSAAVSEEKQYVVDGLEKTAQKLKTDTVISWGCLKKNALELRRALAKRFLAPTPFLCWRSPWLPLPSAQPLS
jgi:hypothetical protein